MIFTIELILGEHHILTIINMHIFFKTDASRSISHVGIYMTNNKFAHASTSQGVTISDLSEPYWQKRLYSLGRVLKN